MNLSDHLFQLAGFFEKYQKTGGVISPPDAQFLSAHLSACAERARALVIAHKAVADEFDKYIETSGAPVDQRPLRAFHLIEGGRC